MNFLIFLSLQENLWIVEPSISNAAKLVGEEPRQTRNCACGGRGHARASACDPRHYASGTDSVTRRKDDVLDVSDVNHNTLPGMILDSSRQNLSNLSHTVV